MYASSFDLHDRFVSTIACAVGTAVWMRSLPLVRYGKDRLLVSGRVEHRSASWPMHGSGSVRFVVDSIALNKCAGLATSVSAVIHLQYASRSCRGLRVGMVIAGGLHGFVVTNRKLRAHEIPFSSFLLPDHDARMSFAARGQKTHMLFAPLEWPYSDKLVAACTVCSGIA